MLKGGMRGMRKGYVRTLRPRFKRFKERRKKKRAVSENENRRRNASIVSLRHLSDKMNNASNENPNARRIYVGFLKNTLQKR